MERHICIHGHFYQPPRENPWLEAIELQDTAYPYHDWNERIASECYATNATSRILDEKNRIRQIVNNYAKISFNFGPTLIAWVEKEAPDLYKAILEADRESEDRYSGHGSALAQPYNHMILPLANDRDKYTQVLWGMRDFEHRFGRKPEGMWLPETAVDLKTLETLVDLDIRFTILAPHQASRVRPIGEGKWQDVSGDRIDATMSYRLNLPSGRSIALFFYDGAISRGVAFEGLLSKGETFAQRLLGGFDDKRAQAQIVHIATDGESYGHHHRFGDMALAYALHYIESNALARLTNYGEYLEKHPPTHEVEIFENSSWSCAHGVERWQNDCGCNSGGHPGWNQAWRAPLREALDWVRDTLAPAYDKKVRSLLRDAWAARNEYIGIVLDRSSEGITNFFKQHAVRSLSDKDRVTALKLLELQRHAMLMYTSCGWFFDELSGIETVQVMQYAGRALQLAQEVLGDALEPRFMEQLQQAESNIAEHENGAVIYEKFVKPAMLDLEKVGAHYAMSSLFEDYGEEVRVSCYRIARESYYAAEAGKAKLAMGRVTVTSEITQETGKYCFGILHWGDHNMSGSVRMCQGEDPSEEVAGKVTRTFAKADFTQTLQLLESHFGASKYSLRNLFRDEQRRILDMILATTLDDVEAVYRQVYENNAPLLRFLKELGIPRPRALYAAADLVLNVNLRRAFEEEELDPDAVEDILNAAILEGASWDAYTSEMFIRRKMEERSEKLLEDPAAFPLLQQLDAAAGVLRSLPFEVNFWKVQNTYYEMLQSVYPGFKEKAAKGNKRAREWVSRFRDLGQKLSVYVE